MKSILKKLILESIRKYGYEIRKIGSNDFDILYEKGYTRESLILKKFYNIGAGKFHHKYWTNIDYHNDFYRENNLNTQDIEYDLFSLEPLPIESNSAELLYTSHTIEHIHDRAASHLFIEAYRILKKNGVLRITTPDIELAWRALNRNDRFFFNWIKEYSNTDIMKQMKLNKPMTEASLAQIFLYHFASSVSELHDCGVENPINDKELELLFKKYDFNIALDKCTERCSEEIQKKYPFNHMNWWSKSKLTTMLRNSGFNKIIVSGFGQSIVPVLRDISIFDNTVPQVSLYLEAKK